MTDPLLEAVDLGRRGRGDDWLLRHISFAVSRGDRIGLAGPTGAGKTMLLRAMCLLDEIDEGEVRFEATAVLPHTVPRFRTRVMYVSQRATLLPGSVEENLLAPYSLAVHATGSFARERIDGWLERVGRDERFLQQQADNLSGGESQLVALLRAMQLDPDILLLDEPTSALDATTTKLAEALVADWHADGERACVWVSHDANQVQRVADRVMRLDRGRLVGVD